MPWSDGYTACQRDASRKNRHQVRWRFRGQSRDQRLIFLRKPPAIANRPVPSKLSVPGSGTAGAFSIRVSPLDIRVQLSKNPFPVLIVSWIDTPSADTLPIVPVKVPDRV